MCDINSELQQIGLQYKQQLINKNLESNIEAILLLKNRLLGVNDEEFVKVVVDLNIHEFLLNHLNSCNPSIKIHVLQCIQQLCNYKIYYGDHAAKTAEIILKSMIYQIEGNNFDILKLSIKTLTTILENLNNFHISKELRYDRFISTINELLLHQTNSTVLTLTIELFTVLLSYNQFEKHVGKRIFEQVTLVWDNCLKTLPVIYENDVKLSVVTASKFCDISLRFAIKLSCKKHVTIVSFLKTIEEHTLNYLKFVCVPFIAEYGLKSNEIYISFLLLLKTILQHNFPKNELTSLCEYLVENNIFVVVANYFNLSYNLVWSKEDQNKLRQICLVILCEIIINIEDENLYPYSIIEYKNYMYKHLQQISTKNFKDWLSCLSQESIALDVKLCVVKYCTTYYVQSDQISELNSHHLHTFVKFLADLANLSYISLSFAKDIWLLYAVLFCLNVNIKTDDYYLYRATRNLQKLILSHKNFLKQIMTYHSCILRWMFWSPFVSNELKLAVMYLWLMRSQKIEVSFKQLTLVIEEKPEVANLLLQAIKDGSSVISELSSNVLRFSLDEGNLKQSKKFCQDLSIAITHPLKEISRQNIVEKYVINSIYLLHLASCTEIPVDPNVITYSVEVFTRCVGKIGITEMLPTVFYTQAFEYVRGILATAKTHEIKAVFSMFLNSKPMLHTLMCALASDEKEITIRASKIFCSLLEYQNRVQVKTGNQISFSIDYLIKMLTISDENQLQVNLQLTKELFNSNEEYALNVTHPLKEKFIKGLYLRCLALVWKPGDKNISKYGLKMMISILEYVHNNNLPVLNYLCNHSCNHTLVLMYSKSLRKYDRNFLQFVLIWLRFSQINNEKMFNKFSITLPFWKMSLVILTEYFLNDNEITTDFLDLSFDILKELQKFDILLPLPLKQSLNDYFKMEREGPNE